MHFESKIQQISTKYKCEANLLVPPGFSANPVLFNLSQKFTTLEFNSEIVRNSECFW